MLSCRGVVFVLSRVVCRSVAPVMLLMSGAGLGRGMILFRYIVSSGGLSWCAPFQHCATSSDACAAFITYNCLVNRH